MQSDTVEIDEIDDVEFDDEGQPYIVHVKIQPLNENAAVMERLMKKNFGHSPLDLQSAPGCLEHVADQVDTVSLAETDWEWPAIVEASDHVDTVSLAETDWEWPEIVEISTKYDLEIANLLPETAHRALRVLVDHAATRGGALQALDLTTEAGCSTIYSVVRRHLTCPANAFMLSHGKLGSFGRTTMPRSGPIKNILDVSKKETVVLRSSGQILGGTKQYFHNLFRVPGLADFLNEK